MQQQKPLGWSLDEAVVRTADTDALYATELIDGELNRAGGAITHAEFADLVRRGVPEKRLWGRKQIMDDLDEARGRLLASLDRDVRGQRLFAIRVGQETPLSLPEWSRTFRRRDLADVRFFPLLWLPDAAERLAGLDLPEAFRRAIARDPEVRASADRDCIGPVLDGMFTFTRKDWPAEFETWNIVAEWLAEHGDPAAQPDSLNPPRYRLALWHPIGPNLLEAGRVVSDRMMRFLTLFRTGALVAPPEAPERWSSPFVWIDFRNGHLCDQDDGRLSRSSSPSLKVIKGTMVAPVVFSCVKAQTDCEAWLTDWMRTAPNDKPMPKNEIFKKARVKFGCPRRAFDRAYANATAQTGATWSAPGRPGKSPHQKPRAN